MDGQEKVQLSELKISNVEGSVVEGYQWRAQGQSWLVVIVGLQASVRECVTDAGAPMLSLRPMTSACLFVAVTATTTTSATLKGVWTALSGLSSAGEIVAAFALAGYRGKIKRKVMHFGEKDIRLWKRKIAEVEGKLDVPYGILEGEKKKRNEINHGLFSSKATHT